MAYDEILEVEETGARDDQFLSNQSEHSQDHHDAATQTSTQPRRKKNVIPALLVILAILMIAFIGAVVAQLFFGRTEKAGKVQAVDIEEVKDSVVMVEVYDENGDLFATGSGFCAYEENWIVTNFHVIEGAKSIKVITDDRREHPTDGIVFFNREQDVAVLSFDGSLKPLELGDGSNIKIKDEITTVGSPKGELNTVSEGIISNVDDKEQIRITAPISHGSSGGVLLNQKNEVIGITSAGYDDAQNLNFAINISLLEKLYDKYKSNDTTSISVLSVSDYAGSLDNFDDYLQSANECYEVSSIDVFHELTSDRIRFEELLLEKDYSWFCIYRSLNQSDQETIVSLFMELNKYRFDDDDVAGDIGGWGVADFFISLGVLNRYEYAITLVDVGNYTDKDSMFDHVADNYPLKAAEKTLIICLIGEYDWSRINPDNKEDICEYFDSRYEPRDVASILDMLGYEVMLENDGTLSVYL